MDDVKKAKSDIILYAVLTVAGLILRQWIIPAQVKITKSTKAEAFNPDTFPKAIALLFITICFAGFVLAIARYIKSVKQFGKPDKNRFEFTKRNVIGILMPYIVFALVLAYIILFWSIGFIPATLIAPPLILFTIGCRSWKYYLIYYVFAMVMYFLFVFILMVPIH